MRTFLFWLMQLTWGIGLNVIGAIIALGLLAKGSRLKRFGYALYCETGNHWGGVNFGGFFFVQKNANLQLKSHEYGHCFQNLMLGPLMPFLVTIPSAIRYHYRSYKRAKGFALPPYDSFWCEGWATRLGVKYYQE
ncbi:hypothetical protein [Bacillus tuaregi]|uniref:hypothetical protein n=1 Tax=Bacillus tuaregi TaxID=1816695 RepID=UPI0008F85ABF|nr:hypothetical protein [Bacillus tuaregi]